MNPTNHTANSSTGNAAGDALGNPAGRTAVGAAGSRPLKPLSVWATAQRDARGQRKDRYLPETTRHPARMLPAVARHAIETLTQPGDLVLDPMCGAGTTLVEALHAGRHAVGIDIEPAWAQLARDNIAYTHRQGVGGHAHVITTDSRMLPGILPPDYLEQMLGRVNLVLTSPPYGNHAHGLIRAAPGRGVAKRNHRYAPHARSGNLAFQPPHRLLAGVTRILAGTRPLLAPDAHIVITTRPWREGGELVDLPGAIAHAAAEAGLTPVQRCVALLAGIREHRLVVRASFFQRSNTTNARRAGQPWHLICHEDLLIFRAGRTRSSSGKLKQRQGEPGRSLASFSGLGARVRNESEGVSL